MRLCLSIKTKHANDLSPTVGKVNPAERDETSVHPIWKDSRAIFSISGDWADDAPEEEKRKIKKDLVDISGRLGKIVGENGGTYINEANP